MLLKQLVVEITRIINFTFKEEVASGQTIDTLTTFNELKELLASFNSSLDSEVTADHIQSIEDYLHLRHIMHLVHDASPKDAKGDKCCSLIVEWVNEAGRRIGRCRGLQKNWPAPVSR